MISPDGYEHREVADSVGDIPAGGGGVDYTLHFYCCFSKPLTRHGVWRAEIPEDWPRGNFDVQNDAYQQAVAQATVSYGDQEARGRHLGFFTEFATTAEEQVLLKCGISYVSMEGAQANHLRVDPTPGRSFTWKISCTDAEG